MQNDSYIVVIAGPNGSGKTTAALKVLPNALSCIEFLNADEIAKGLSPLNPTSVKIQSGKLLIQRANGLIQDGISFGIETTLSGQTQKKIIETAKAKGYSIILLYFWVQSPQLALKRIKARVKKGGHDVPKIDVLRRYKRSIRNLFHLYLPLADSWMIFDNSGNRLELIAITIRAIPINEIHDESIWKKITKQGELNNETGF